MTPSTIVYAAPPKDKGNLAPRAGCVCGATLPVLWTDKFGKNMVTQTASQQSHEGRRSQRGLVREATSVVEGSSNDAMHVLFSP